jgi:hypothetical protein
MQNTWEINSKVMEKAKLKNIPPYMYQLDDVIHNDQLNAYKRCDDSIMKERGLLRDIKIAQLSRQLQDNMLADISHPLLDDPDIPGFVPISTGPIIEEVEDETAASTEVAQIESDADTGVAAEEPVGEEPAVDEPVEEEPTEEEIRLEEKRLAMIEAVRVSSGLSQNYRRL